MEGKLILRVRKEHEKKGMVRRVWGRKEETEEIWEDQMVEMMLTNAVSSYYVSFTDSISLTV